MDGFHFNGDHFICSPKIDGEQGDQGLDEIEPPESMVPDGEPVRSQPTISLLELAQPAKRKGVSN